MLSHREKIALFVDGSNLWETTNAVGMRIDFKRVLDHFRKFGRLVRAKYYSAVREQSNGIQDLLYWLDFNGWTVIQKETREFRDPRTGVIKIKGNMDIEMAVDMMKAAVYVDHIYLFTGDGDFRYLVQAVQDMGVRVTVVSSIQTNPPFCANELRKQADDFLDLVDIRKHVERTP